MMSATSTTALNDGLILLYRSLVQYAAECWPWSNAAELETAVRGIAAEQMDSIEQINQLLVQRGEYVELGAYPTEYTDLHYVSLKYLLRQMSRNQHDVIAGLQAACSAATDDTEAAALLKSVCTQAEKHLRTLQDLIAAQK
jgi:hypothetical protein